MTDHFGALAASSASVVWQALGVPGCTLTPTVGAPVLGLTVIISESIEMVSFGQAAGVTEPRFNVSFLSSKLASKPQRGWQVTVPDGPWSGTYTIDGPPNKDNGLEYRFQATRD